MLKIENTEIYGWRAAVRGMRNALESWDKSDSTFEGEPRYLNYIGKADLELAKRLIAAGDDHGKVARYLDITVDITAPFYFWKEFKTYREGRKIDDDGDELINPEELEMHIETNSCSTMHKIAAKEFTLDDFSCEHLTGDGIEVFEKVIGQLNFARIAFLETKNKDYWWEMIQLLPSSYNQKRTVKLNYQVLRKMYHARKNHKLDEWHTFCDWVETLPYSELICGDKK